jgi:hypothetical protein
MGSQSRGRRRQLNIAWDRCCKSFRSWDDRGGVGQHNWAIERFGNREIGRIAEIAAIAAIAAIADVIAAIARHRRDRKKVIHH